MNSFMSFKGELTPLNFTSKGSLTGKSLAGTKPFSSFRIGIGDPQYRCLDTPQSLSLKFVDSLPQFNSIAFFSIALKAFKAIEKKAIELNCGKESTNFRLRDWGVSRQRYWGSPIPILKDEKGFVPAKDLPVKLPLEVKFKGVNSPLKDMKEFINIEQDGKSLKRETDTFDTFFESSWYYARFASFDSENSMLDLSLIHI